MLIVALAIVLAALASLVIKRMQHTDPAAQGGPLGWVIACLGAVLALRAGLSAPVPLRVALCLLAIAALTVWLRRRGQGDGPGDDGRDPPVDPGPGSGSGSGSGHHVKPPAERLESKAFDRARADWEHALKKHARD